ncbi:hypothetical protein [Alkalihalobacillus pseudalcaliphilus]|uniref:hypothetical protein n=1 Tax=Alkalihalobacillus pseudalcaliphilus TaxID=79884 RepID=UPI00064DC6E5|nr:hypothetical protein [Alkalihalobacillus pseudalcaliphilus]KMK74912.1 hypothetical protein AB990_18620 [Alkalihalobacillus pseudalcaliphilus]
MLGFLLTTKEVQEVEYMLKRELEEILLDLTDPRIDHVVKHAMEEKYEIVYGIFKRIVSPEERLKYALPKAKRGLQ